MHTLNTFLRSYHTRLISILAKRDYKDGKTLSYNIVAFLEIEQILIIFYFFTCFLSII